MKGPQYLLKNFWTVTFSTYEQSILNPHYEKKQLSGLWNMNLVVF